MIKLTCIELTTLIIMLKLIYSTAIACIFSVMKVETFRIYLIASEKNDFLKERTDALIRIANATRKCFQKLRLANKKLFL